jgi:polyisoprenoid-binding protein YceI
VPLLGAGLWGCKSNDAPDPTQGIAKAALAAPRDKPTPGPATYEFSSKDSTIAFVGSNVMGKQEGTFTSFSGTISASDGDPARATVSLSVEVASIQTSNPDLTKHLLSAEFLDASNHPTLKFISTKISPDNHTFLIEGVFEMRGVERQITFPAQLTLTPGAPGAKAEFLLDRQAFGVSFKGASDNLIRDDVVVRLDIKAHPVNQP